MPSPRNPFLYPEPGRCIYCGDDKADLTEEHIIPFALDGEWAIPEASCSKCAKLTCRAEGICLGDMMKAARTRFKASSRRRRPKTLPVTYIGVDGKRRTKQVAPEDHPTTIFIVAPPPPRLLRDIFPPWTHDASRLWIHGDGMNLEKHPVFAGERMELGAFNELAYARMMAKIGHSFAVAILGIEGFKPFLTDFIRERSGDYTDFIGGDPRPSPKKPVKHQMQLNRHEISGVLHAVVAIQLFAKFGAPVFQVIAGQIQDGKNQRSWR
jgi:hypothetical protein